MALSPDTRLGRYQIRSLLGAGGMGEVYLAQDTELGRTVALKLMPSNVTSDRQRMNRFIQEAKAASALNHPNILTIHEVGLENGAHFIVTEFIDGETLRERIARTRMRLGEVLDIAIQVASALSGAHQAGIVHRDVKPENIMVRRDGYVKVLDFGLAKLTEQSRARLSSDSDASTLIGTDPGVVMGTVSYMSPEQARGLGVDARSDAFSLGVVLYEMVTGRKPFEGPTASDVIVSILEREPAPLLRYASESPEELSRIIEKALEKDPEERYQTIKDMALDLRRLKRRLEAEAEIDRSAQPEAGAAVVGTYSDGRPSEKSQESLAGRTGSVAAGRPTSSAEYIISEIKSHKRGAALALAGVVAIVAAAGFALYKYAGRSSSPAAFQSMKITKLTSNGKVGTAAISPDGKYVVHAAKEAGGESLWMRQVATNSNVQIIPPADVSYLGLIFSKDGNYIYFTRYDQPNTPSTVLYQMPVLGGAARKLSEGLTSAVALSPDGKQLAFVRSEVNQTEELLVVANADGTGERKLATRRAPEYFLTHEGGPAWSLDGKVIACVTFSTQGKWNPTVVEIPVEGGAERPINSSQTWNWIDHIAWLSDGSRLLINGFSEAESPGQIWYLSKEGETQRITNDPNTYYGLSLTADSGNIVTVQHVQNSNIWIAPGGEASRARQITSGVGHYSNIKWVPDGRIVYATGGTEQEIWVMEPDGSGHKQLTSEGRNLFPSVCADGRHIVFMSNRTGGDNIWRMDTDGGNQRQLTNGGSDFGPACSPDGKWVVYVSASTGIPVLWKVSIHGGAPTQLTNHHAELPIIISPDGKWIATRYREDGTSKMVVGIIPFEGGPPVKTFDNLGYGVRWSPDGRALTYRKGRGIANLWSQPVDGGKPLQITDFKSDYIFSFDWSRDGKLLALSRGNTISDVVLISNFK